MYEFLIWFIILCIMYLTDIASGSDAIKITFFILASYIIAYLLINPTLGLIPFNYIFSAFTKEDTFYTEKEKIKIFPTSKILEDNWKDIKKEYFQICEHIKDNDNVGRLFINEKEEFWKGWKSYPLLLFGNRYEDNLSKCPTLNKIISSDPNILTAFFSVVEPFKTIPSHYGPYKGILRYHLGLKIPNKDSGECFISVNDQIYEWKEGEGVLFDESHKHFVINSTNESRVVLFLDVKRPLGFPLNIMNDIILFFIKYYPINH